MSAETLNRSAGGAGDDVPTPPAGRAERVRSSIVLAVVAGIGVAIMVVASGLGVGGPSAPGAGLWPLIIGAVWTVSGIVAAIQAWRGASLPSIRPIREPLIGVGLVLLFILVFSYVDMTLAVLVVSLLWMLLLSDSSWPKVVISSAVIAAVIYVVFVLIVRTPLPASLIPHP
ncbi:Tricarboxylate transport protein TctB [Actinomycetales bacterium JB111]|nr:Tricarboxylate transport protein TctB [Actinomycetales bacterium JB111]